MAEVATAVVADYLAALRNSYQGNREIALLRAYEAGRVAADEGVPMLDIVAAHHEELADLVARSDDPGEVIRSATQVLAEFLASFEMAHRGYRDALDDLRESHARQQSILEHLPAIVSLQDPAGRYLSVNPGFERATGRRAQDVRGLRDAEVFPGGHPLAIPTDPPLDPGAPTYDEIRIEQEDGTHDYLRVRFAVVDRDQQLVAVCAIATDVTERTRAAALVREERDRADRSNAAKTKFISSMSHDMRTPLNAILGYAQLLQLDELAENQRADVAEIEHAGNLLLDLINEAIDIGTIEEGRLVLDIQPCALRTLTQNTVAVLRSLAERRDVSIDLDVEGEVLADCQRLERVLMNLLSNAIKYNREHGSITVRTHHRDGVCRLEVTDTGHGLDADDTATLFVRFHRVRPDEHTDVEGSGLGLALCKNLVEAMGGRIGVESTVGVGSTFWVELPTAGVRSGDREQCP